MIDAVEGNDEDSVDDVGCDVELNQIGSERSDDTARKTLLVRTVDVERNGSRCLSVDELVFRFSVLEHLSVVWVSSRNGNVGDGDGGDESGTDVDLEIGHVVLISRGKVFSRSCVVSC